MVAWNNEYQIGIAIQQQDISENLQLIWQKMLFILQKVQSEDGPVRRLCKMLILIFNYNYFGKLFGK
jgi:hypothetical protein